MTSLQSLTRCVLLALGASSLGACAKLTTQSAASPSLEPHSSARPNAPVAWGIPNFFEVGPQVRLDGDGPRVDTTGWPAAFLRTSSGAPRGYLSAVFEDQSRVFVYPELDPTEQIRRYAMIVPEPKSFSTNGVVTAFWGRSPLFMNFALGAARSFASFTTVTPSSGRRVVPLRARLEPSGVNPQDSENVYELEESRLNVFEHKGLVPGEPLSFLEFSIYDRDSMPDEAEPTPIDASIAKSSLSVALVPLEGASWPQRESFESNGYRVVLVGTGSGARYFLATPLQFQPGWGFGEASTDLTLGPLESSTVDAEPSSAAALTLEHATHGWLLSGAVHDARDVPALLERGESFRVQLAAARRELAGGARLEFAARAAHAFVAAHRSLDDPRTLTGYAHGDAPQPSNSTAGSAGARYGRDLAGALRALLSVQAASHDLRLQQDIAHLAEASLEAAMPSGASSAQQFDRLSLVAERDERSGRSDVFIDNGSLAVSVNHRRLLLASARTHAPRLTWGAFGATIDGESSSVDDAGYEFSIDGTSLPRVLAPSEKELGVSRLFTSRSVRVRETARLQRDLPAIRVEYQLENRGDRAVTVNEACITLADFLEYGAGANENSQGRYGLGHVADGVRLPVGFWMEGMKTPVWGDTLAPGEHDLTEQYRSLGARFILVYAYDRAQIYYLARPADRLLLYNGNDGQGLTRLEARYATRATLPPHGSYELPRILSHTLRAPLQSTDGDAIPDQLQELAPLWTNLVSGEAQSRPRAPLSFETDSRHAELVYSWIQAANALASSGVEPALTRLAARLEQSALRGSAFALNVVNELRKQDDWLPTYANGHDYGFHLGIFDWAYRKTCDVRYRDAFLTLADDLARADKRGGLQISDPQNPSYGGFLATQQSRASGATQVGDQGIRLWALRIAYERTRDAKYRRSAELFLDHWLRLDPQAHTFTGTVFVDQRYRDAGPAEEGSPLGHQAVLAGLKAWSDVLPRARALYAAGFAAATGRQVVHGVGLTGPRRLIAPREGVADFSDDIDLGGMFLWAMTLDPNALRGRFVADCRGPHRSAAAAFGTH